MRVSVHVLIYGDAAREDPLEIVQLKETNGVWTACGPRSWEGCYYVYEVYIYHPNTLQIERCLANDPYDIGLSADGKRTLLVNIDSDACKPEGWESLADEKPDVVSFSDISIYELHVKDFRSPLVSFLYERSWRQNFNYAGFPGPDEEVLIAVTRIMRAEVDSPYDVVGVNRNMTIVGGGLVVHFLTHRFLSTYKIWYNHGEEIDDTKNEGNFNNQDEDILDDHDDLSADLNDDINTNHYWRNNKEYDGSSELSGPPRSFSGEDIVKQLEEVPIRTTGKAPNNSSRKRKRGANELNWNQVLLGGPVNPRWMFGTERHMGLYKRYMRNMTRPDGSIEEAFVVDEAISFLSRYVSNIETRFSKPDRNWDLLVPNHQMDIFKASVRALGADFVQLLGGWKNQTVRYKRRKTTRGMGTSKIARASSTGKLSVVFYVNRRQPICTNAERFDNEIGFVVRNHGTFSYKDWRLVPEEVRAPLRSYLMENFDIDLNDETTR
ncbi:hypothetical protein POM88_012898 [Heracleum sosnowskyi]|uniref:DUF4218 domain-containing protein n=1 Tax=Heracleum sosnowskyi TaxID=360622 RepID=A0AAD8N2W6_9APIA|nr:hypothetical protein POM88_012898 [Heracleum sosnowskyi]